MFKRILVPIDGSSTADRGLKLALLLAKEHEATLYVVHVVDDLSLANGFGGATYLPAEYIDNVLAGLRDAGRQVLDRAQKMALQHGQRVEALLIETHGQRVADAILARARKLRVELIVLGTHGRRGLARLLMGSDAETIVREARIPVLLVRSPVTTRTTRKVGAPAETRRAAVAAPPHRKTSAQPQA